VKGRLRALFSRFPNITARYDVAELRNAARKAMEQHWDGIVFDGPGNMACFDEIHIQTRTMNPNPFLAYVSHNHEETTRFTVAHESRGGVQKLLQTLDGWKTALLERRVVHLCDIVTTNTDIDAALFRKNRPNLRSITIMPGYDGAKSPHRDLADTPRTVVVLGSYVWVAKQTNVESLLTAAAAVFKEARIKLKIVGYMEKKYQVRLRRAFPWADIVGPVKSTRGVLANARIGIVPERAGGGFKHKFLDYAFARLPIAALNMAAAGVPLKAGRDFIATDTIEELVRSIANNIDDTHQLQVMADSAYDVCETEFDWNNRCRTLLSEFEKLSRDLSTA
jgi:glycosyltransferase involved in cell wall biosynthesis